LGIGPNPQSPIPNPQSPIPNIFIIKFIFEKNKNIIIKYKYMSISFSLTKNYQNKKVTQPIMIDEGTNFFSPIHNTPLTKLPPENWTQNLSPKLPPQNIIQYKKKKKTLILDLDETLVHSSMNPFPKCADITLPINFNGRNIFVYVLKRPFLEIFLEEMKA
jgi:hypothetical protein